MVIYKTTNLINGKIYVGKDVYNKPKYLGSGILIKKAIKKYRKENFIKEIIQICDTIESLNISEIYWIEKLNSRNRKIGYNIALGGEGQKAGTVLTKKIKNKIAKSQTLEGYIKNYGFEIGTLKYNQKINNQSKSQKERYKDPNERQKMSRPGKLNGMYNKKHTKNTIESIRKKRLGKRHTKETIELYKKIRKGTNNRMDGKDMLGDKNPRAKKWKIIDTNNIEYLVNGEISVFTKNNNLSEYLFRMYKNSIIPLNLKIRKSNNIEEYQKRKNSLGWQIYEI